MKLDGFGLFVDDMGAMIRFYRDILGFEIKEAEDTSNVYLIKDGTLFLLYGRKDFETMTKRKYEYVKGLNGHFELALYVDTFEEEELVDIEEVQGNIRRIKAEIGIEDAKVIGTGGLARTVSVANSTSPMLWPPPPTPTMVSVTNVPSLPRRPTMPSSYG